MTCVGHFVFITGSMEHHDITLSNTLTGISYNIVDSQKIQQK